MQMMQISQELAELKQQRDETLNKVKHTLMHSRSCLFFFSPPPSHKHIAHNMAGKGVSEHIHSCMNEQMQMLKMTGGDHMGGGMSNAYEVCA
jgi:hypothetical protein